MFGFSTLKAQLASYLTPNQINHIFEAFKVAEAAHLGQHRQSGEPYISHPLAVASILADMHMDHQSIMAAILHDVIEDTPIEKRVIAEQFGDEVANIVDGVSKLKLIKFESRAEAQAENLRKMMLAMARDIRVILVKLADRLHNMRTLAAASQEQQRRVARETLEIYAPIANRLGMNNFRIEFEDLGFSYLYPMRYKILKESVLKARGNRKELVNNLEKLLKNRLEQEVVPILKIQGREKHLYSLYKKMRDKDLSLTDIMDVYALRVIVDEVDTCYRVLGVVHGLFKPLHGRFKDYIAVPKSNGYQSLHSTVVGNLGVPIEIQIRTEAMDKLAENGIAAHWLYKTNELRTNEAEIRARQWLKGMLELQESSGNSLEFIEHVKIDLYPDEVYVFTPKGDILALAQGSSCVDFAYAVHTMVGNNCIAAKIDRRLVPLSTRLISGHTIEIITASGAHPNPAWLSFVVTAKARSNIRNWLKLQKSSESHLLGKRLFERALKALSLTLDNIDPERLNKVLNELKLESIDKLFEEIGLGNQVAPLMARRLGIDVSSNESLIHSQLPLAIKGTEGMVVNYAKCCRPIPGDEIVGFLSAGRGIVIHREICSNISDLQKKSEKFIFIQWADNVKGQFPVELRIDTINKRGVLAQIANVLSDCSAHVETVQVDDNDSHHSTIHFLVYLKNRIHLARIIKKIRNLEVVTRVSRSK
ncbi:MAG: guanosine 3,5-bis-pyrophosphate (ppGpp) synthetase, RelA/SpoT protein [Francisellaceae bacterium]|nr:guanosine 3,5-bis-pyrophosphate (ppGpp) synthetase, RelA/SpoT protein [Francisellaceae bacterium]